MVKNEGYLIASYTKEEYDQFIYKGMVNMAETRHAGKTGYTLLLDRSTKLPISLPKEMQNAEDITYAFSKVDIQEESVLFKEKTVSKTEYACMYSTVQNYVIYAAIPMEEVMYNRNVSLYLTAFLLHETFSILFIVSFLLIKRNVVDDLCKVNQELDRIGNGELQTRVRVYSSQEFSELSDDINDTVIALNHYIDEANARIDAELRYARTIQSSLLPSIFPAFPNRTEMDIYAKMKPAREVGGDFYDFSFPDEHTLMFMVADVSGKGIPAAMFMMRVRTLIKNIAESGKSPEEVVTMTNSKLVEHNEAEMFVTLWLGYLDLKTGLLTFVNGGHNPPVLIRKGEKPLFLRMRSGLVLGGMPDISYCKNQISVKEGDQIFLYTDGVTEAFNTEQEQYGEDRLLEILDRSKDKTSQQICDEVSRNMNEFIHGAAQFDDITMLSVQFLHQTQSQSENQ